MVTRAEEPGTGASVVLTPTSMGTVAKAELLEGQWRLIKVLGQGAVGQVWHAHDVTLDRAVAVKVMHAELATDPAQVARFEREARVLAGLEHPNLLPVLGIGRWADRPFLVTRLLEGMTLAELMHQRGGKLPAAEAARVLVPICEALACLHDAKVVHRDLKPSNVFVGDDKRVTLMDLGSAHEVGSELTHFGEVLGTAGYLSPEQKLGKRDLDGKSDVYALGALLLEVLTGKVGSENSPGRGIPIALLELARFAMSLSPTDRPTALEVRAKLVPFLATEEPTTPLGKPLLSEASTQAVVFTPTTGSPSYPHLRAVPMPEVQTKEAPAELPTTSSTLVLPLSAAVGDKPTSATHVLPLSAAVSDRPTTPRRAPPMKRGAIALMMVVSLLVLGAFALGLAEPAAVVSAPVRVDKPSVAAPIHKEDIQLHGVIEAPRPSTVMMPRPIERKADATASIGLERRPRKPNRSKVKMEYVRITTTISGFVVPSKLWIQRAANQPYERVGETPQEVKVNPGLIVIRLQYEDDPYIHVTYRVLPTKDQLKDQVGMLIEEEVRNDDTPDEGVSHGEFKGPRVSGASSGKPMTPRPARGGR